MQTALTVTFQAIGNLALRNIVVGDSRTSGKVLVIRSGGVPKETYDS